MENQEMFWLLHTSFESARYENDVKYWLGCHTGSITNKNTHTILIFFISWLNKLSMSKTNPAAVHHFKFVSFEYYKFWLW